MVFCSNCGEKLPKDAYFCPKCGVKTAMGTEANAPTPSDELRQAFAKVSVEIEKAFTIAAKEIQTAFLQARENMQKSYAKEPIICENCKTQNRSDSVYCVNCGAKLGTTGTEKKA